MIQFRAVRELWSDAVTLYARDQIAGKQKALVCDGVKIIDVEDGLLWPTFIDMPMMEGSAQSLFNALWEAGFRPANGESSQSHVTALKSHLRDMRRLAFRDVPTLTDGDI